MNIESNKIKLYIVNKWKNNFSVNIFIFFEINFCIFTIKVFLVYSDREPLYVIKKFLYSESYIVEVKFLILKKDKLYKFKKNYKKL